MSQRLLPNDSKDSILANVEQKRRIFMTLNLTLSKLEPHLTQEAYQMKMSIPTRHM